MSDRDEIRDLITRWAAAVGACDLNGVLAQHDSEVVMFDVPPPYRGVRGIDEYRESWGPFFEWLRKGSTFELDRTRRRSRRRRRLRLRLAAVRHPR